MTEGETLEEVCDRSRADVLFSCFSARCGACRVRVVSGMENLAPADDLEADLLAQLEAGPSERLACQCRVAGPVSLSTRLKEP